ncbi:DUF4342 domain-containing protein [Clostridium polynesiense]|uniref:DUF4342 domain-containing protein n=1 Tax=Clostridium polynesiense TaxID=1325933 RepID=UPI00058D1E54|nr:DUF4342 domain-containing protein [Clostridium polynesiense]
MVTIEQIDELRKRVDVTYEEAKAALEQTNGDVLEAVIYLEKNHKYKKDDNFKESKENFEDSFSKSVGRFINYCKKVLKKGNSNHILIEKNDNIILRLSLTIFVLVLVLVPYMSIPLLIIALFTGHKFSFQGKDVEKTQANEALRKMSEAAENIKAEASK